MTVQELAAALHHRLRRRAYWAVFGFSGIVYGLFVLSQPISPWHKGTAVLTGFLYFFAIMWLAPIPWQWSGCQGGIPKPWRAGIQAFVGVEILMALMTLLDEVLSNFPHRPPFNGHTYLVQACFSAVNLFLAGNVLAHREWQEAEKLVLSRKASEAQTRVLQGQLHPHVLFNALNALAELYRDDPALAETHLRSMSDLLRQVLLASERNTLPLSEERILVERYLLMESARLGDRLRVTWEWERGLDMVPVPPLLLQPLVENALKHGISPAKRGGELVIASTWDGLDILLQVRNTGRPFGGAAPGSNGVGLRNLRERLALAYGPPATLELRTEGEWTHAEIRINPLHLLPHMREQPPREIVPMNPLRLALEEA